MEDFSCKMRWTKSFGNRMMGIILIPAVQTARRKAVVMLILDIIAGLVAPFSFFSNKIYILILVMGIFAIAFIAIPSISCRFVVRGKWKKLVRQVEGKEVEYVFQENQILAMSDAREIKIETPIDKNTEIIEKNDIIAFKGEGYSVMLDKRQMDEKQIKLWEKYKSKYLK